MNTVFESFDNGRLLRLESVTRFSELAWNNHPSFSGVSLKHLVTSHETGGLFSYHLVRIAPGHAIGDHIHETQLETHEVIEGTGICRLGEVIENYHPGVISIIPSRLQHSVEAGLDGLLLFAKFMPPLC